MNKKHIYLVDTKLICYYLFQRGSSITGMYDKIAQLLYTLPKGDIYLGWDIGKSSYRLSISPTYKGHRASLKDKLSDEDKEALQKFNDDYLKLAELSDLLPVYNLKVDGVECDDMCSIIAKQFENKADYQIYLLTADMDWIHSVIETDNVAIIDMYNGGAIIDREVAKETYNLDTRRKFTVLKSILGDKSDNIKFCHNLGPIKARELFDLIYKDKSDPSDDEIIAKIDKYLEKKEADRLAKNRKLSITVHTHHIDMGRLSAREAFLANMAIADPFTDTSSFSEEQLEAFNNCLSRKLPDNVLFSDILHNSIDKLGFALQFGHKASKIFKVL